MIEGVLGKTQVPESGSRADDGGEGRTHALVPPLTMSNRAGFPRREALTSVEVHQPRSRAN